MIEDKIMEKSLMSGVVKRPIHKCTLDENSSNDDFLRETNNDLVVLEEPLEILLNGDLISITMRTPGNDDFLAVGFLFSEGVIQNVSDLGSVTDSCQSEEGCNIINVSLPNKSSNVDKANGKKLRRGTLTSAACGVCGRQSIDDMLEICEKQSVDQTMTREVVAQSTQILSDNQKNFSLTGGCHCAAVLTDKGDVLASYEDIGRHNAVDKTIGDLIMKGIVSRPSENNGSDDKLPMILVVSGRLSFEIVQKSAVASIPVIASVSAPSSLAVDLAEEVGITIASFVRDSSFNLYTHPERIK